MDFILENYLIIILVGLFFVFALIGYLIEILRQNKKIEKDDIPTNIKPVEIKDIKVLEESKQEKALEKSKEIKEEVETPKEKKSDEIDGDDLLKNYDENISE